MVKFVDIIILRLKIPCSVKMHTSGTFWTKIKKLVVEHGNIYKFMKMMYKIQCQKPSEIKIERQIKQQCQKPSERQIKKQCQKPSERQIEQ